jgi:hypothetical protein
MFSASVKNKYSHPVEYKKNYASVSVFIHERNPRGDSLEKDHPSGAHSHTRKRHNLSSLARPPQRRIEHEIGGEHLYARGINQHSRADRAQHAFRNFQPHTRTRALIRTATEYDEAREYAGGCGDCKEEREQRAQPADQAAAAAATGRGSRLLFSLGIWFCHKGRRRSREGGYANAERETFEELMERNRGYKRLKIGARCEREGKSDDQRVEHDAELQDL